MPVEPPELIVLDAAAWHAWLGENHAEQIGVWLVLAKKGTTEPTTPELRRRDPHEPEPLLDPAADRQRQARHTRARRVEQFVAMLARGETVHPQRRTLSD